MKFSKPLLMATAMVLMSHPAFAAGGITAGVSTLKSVIDWAGTLGVAVVTIAIMYVGFKMVFQASEWKDVAPIFWGGILIGGAAAIAPALLTTS